MRYLMLVAVLAAAPASAQNVYKCVAADGAITLTSAPCKPGERVASSTYAPPEVVTRDQLLERDRRRRKEDAGSAYLNRLAGFDSPRQQRARPPTESESRDQRCRAAKARRETMRKAAGMKVSFEFTRRLDEMVYDACK